MDAPGLRQAAERSQGKFYNVNTVGRLLKDLPDGRQIRIESLPPVPVWNSWGVALLFLALLAAEWLLRKRLGLL
jgi:hypothetical protein